jgi:PAS domain S-box-containing protein
MDHNPALAFIKDKDGRHVYGNKAVFDFLDCARDEFVGAVVTDVFPPAIAAQMETHDHEVMARGRVVVDEFHVPQANGGKRWLRIIKFPLTDAAGETILGGMAFDVTRQRQAQEALREREEQFRQLTESILEVYWLRDIPSRRMLYVSPAYETIWGRPPQHLIDHPESFLEAVHAEDLPRVQKAVREQANGRYFDEEFRIVRPDGGVRWVHARTFPVADAAGAVYRLAGVAADITERKQAETYLESTLDSSLNGIMALQAVRDAAGTIVDFEWVLINEMTERMVGRSQEELIGKRLNVEMPGIREDGLFDLYVRVVETGETLELEHFYDHESVRGWFHVMAVKLNDGFVVTFADITAYKEALNVAQTQRALADALVNTAEVVNQTLQLDAVLERILDSIGAVVPHECANVALLDADKTYLHVAQSCSCQEESALPPPLEVGDRLADQPPLQVMFNSGQPLHIAETAGDPRWPSEYAQIASFLGAPILVDGAVIGFLNLAAAAPGFFTSEHEERLRAFAPQAAIAIRNAQLHESVQTQLAQLRQAQARLVQSEKLAAIGELVAGVAHELNNPLASIVLYSQLLQADRGRENNEEALAQIVTQAQRANGIVNNLLDFARQRPKTPELVSLNDVLRSTVDLLSYELRTHNIEVRLRLAAASPMIMGDVQQLQQVFVNLLNNAMGAQQGQGNGRVAISSVVAAPRYLADVAQAARVTVRDNGPGMATAVRKRVFDPFFTTKEPGQGTGLGLSVCHGIVSEHEGGIWVESEMGEGTTFFIEFPLASSAPPPAAAKPAAAPAAPPAAGAGSQKRILIIDDEKAIRLVLSRILEEHYEVEAAANGRDALEKVTAVPYHLVICDVYMPGMGGLDFYRAWRERQPEQAQRTSFLFITGDTVSPYVKEQLDAIDAPFLHKPFDLDALLAQVHALLPEA